MTIQPLEHRRLRQREPAVACRLAAIKRRGSVRAVKYAILVLAGLAAGCGETPPQVIAPVAVPDMGRPAPFPVEIESSRMSITARPTDGSRCMAYTFPIDGGAAFDAAVRDAASDAARPEIRRLSVTGERLTYTYDSEPPTPDAVMLTPTATITARFRLDTSAGPTAATIRATGSGRQRLSLSRLNCDAMAAALAEAYRAALRDLAAQLSNRIRLAR